MDDIILESQLEGGERFIDVWFFGKAEINTIEERNAQRLEYYIEHYDGNIEVDVDEPGCGSMGTCAYCGRTFAANRSQLEPLKDSKGNTIKRPKLCESCTNQTTERLGVDHILPWNRWKYATKPVVKLGG